MGTGIEIMNWAKEHGYENEAFIIAIALLIIIMLLVYINNIKNNGDE